MKKIGLMGFGKTGKAVASVILQHNEFKLEWVLRKKHVLENRDIHEYLGFESPNTGKIYSIETIDISNHLDEQPVDYIIDFSADNGIYYYGEEAAKRKVKIISAISHYEPQEVNFLRVLSKQTTVFWSPNITIGINFLLLASKYLQKIAPYADIEIIEEHFKQKKGISGTALKIAEVLDLDKTEINSIRAGGIIGKHELIFGFPYQTVRLIHESISREAFGNGVIFVAQNLKDKQEGFYTFEELLIPYFQK
ncbi:MAG: dihydrodipicolinate reductase C-terminal domain-containing protein [Bacteroidales bacterium]